MSLLITKYPLVLNLPAIFRDFGLTPAELKNKIEGFWLSADSQSEASARREDIYFAGDTKCDGYLLSYSFDTLDEYIAFENYIFSLEYDLEQTVHVMYSYCLWVKKITIQCVKEDQELKLMAIRHVDDPRNELHLNRKVRADISKAVNFVIETSTLRLSLDYIDYQDRGVVKFLWESFLSIIKTGFSHIHHYRPRLHEETITHEQNIVITDQVLPGLLALIPQSELYNAVKFESKMPYLSSKS